MSEDIDRKLRAWASRHTPSESHLEELTRTVTTLAAAAAQRGQVVEPASGGGVLGVSPWQKLVYAGLGAVAALIVMSVAPVSLSFRRPDGAAAAIPAGVSAERLDTAGRLFEGLERLFPDQLRWVCESDGDVTLGLDSDPSASAVSSAPVLVRLNVVCRESRGAEWETIWSADMLVRSEDVIEVTPGQDGQNRVTLWVCPLRDGKVAVDAALSLREPVQVSVESSAVLREGTPARMVCVNEGGTEYAVFQTVMRLTPKGDAANVNGG